MPASSPPQVGDTPHMASSTELPGPEPANQRELRVRARRTRTVPRPGRGATANRTRASRSDAASPALPPETPSEPARRYPFRPWDVLIAIVLLIGIYASVSDQLRVGPSWLVPLLVVGLLFALSLAHRQNRRSEARLLALGMTGIATLAVEGSMAGLVVRLIDGNVYAPYLLRDAALLWIANVIVFALWYWELDGGGPRVRHVSGYEPTDLAFPQIALGRAFRRNWTPQFADYLFVSFTASAAFSPTDTSFLSVRAKLLMMVQAIGSIVILAVVAARAINILS